MTAATPTPLHALDHAPPERVMHFELPLGRHLWWTLRRPPMALMYQVVSIALLACGFLAFLSFDRLSLPEWLVGVLATWVGVTSMFRLYARIVGPWIGNGGHDRIAFLRDDELTIGTGAGSRTYDLSRARCHSNGPYIRICAPTRRWAPDGRVLRPLLAPVPDLVDRVIACPARAR